MVQNSAKHHILSPYKVDKKDTGPWSDSIISNVESICLNFAEAYWEPSQTTWMEFFVEITVKSP